MRKLLLATVCPLIVAGAIGTPTGYAKRKVFDDGPTATLSAKRHASALDAGTAVRHVVDKKKR